MARSTRYPALCTIGSRRSLALAVLAIALLGAGGRHAIAAGADNGDVQVNRDVLDSLGPPTGESASSAGRIHLHAPKAKSKPKQVAATTSSAPKRQPAPPSTPVAAAIVPPESAAPSPTAAPLASPIVPASARTASNAPPSAPAPTPAPPPSATAEATPSAAPPTAMSAPAARPAPVAAAPAPVQTAAATPATPPLPPTRLIFAAGTADLPDGAKPELDKVAHWLDTNSLARIEVIAYASGSAEEANQARRVSLSRALAVRSYLAERGVATLRMEVRALGNRSENGAPADRVDVVALDH